MSTSTVTLEVKSADLDKFVRLLLDGKRDSNTMLVTDLREQVRAARHEQRIEAMARAMAEKDGIDPDGNMHAQLWNEYLETAADTLAMVDALVA